MLETFIMQFPFGLFQGDSLKFVVIPIVSALIIASIIAGGLIVSSISYLSQRNHSKYQRLYEVYKMTNDFDERESRKNIYEAYRIYKNEFGVGDKSAGGEKYVSKNIYKNRKFDDIFRDPLVIQQLGFKGENLLQDVERVRATFDNIGSLFGQNLIPDNALLGALWGTGRVCWICLEANIMIERDKRKTKFYMNNFEIFYNKIEKYRLNHKPPLEAVEPY